MALELKKIILINYYYPPSNFVGGFRTSFWAENLHKFGFYPIVITRNWNENQKTITEEVNDNKIKHEKYKSHEIYRIPYKRSFRDKIANNKSLKLLRKILTYIELTFCNFFIKTLPYQNIYNQSKEILNNDKSIKYLIISGTPFYSFQLGYRLKQKYNLLWIADYRDEWTTHKNLSYNSIFEKFIFKLNQKSEKKWLSNSDLFISTSDEWVDSISKFNNKKGVAVLNGLSKELDSERFHSTNINSYITITYAGTLYENQNLDVFIDAINNIHNDKIKINFIGTETNISAHKFFLEKTKLNSKNFNVIEKIPKVELLKYYEKSDFLLLTSLENNKGWYPVKMFDYFDYQIPILMCPSDNSVMEEFITKTNGGIIIKSVNELEIFLNQILSKKKNKEKLNFKINISEAKKYSRIYQTELLSNYLLSLKCVE